MLLVRGSPRDEMPGWWQLPGGGVEHGEHPMAAVVREVGEETGYRVAVTRLRDAVAEVVERRDGDLVHHDRLLFEIEVRGGDLRAEISGTSDVPAWFAPPELAGLPMQRYVAYALGQPSGSVVPGEAAPAGLAAGAGVPVEAAPVDGPLPARRQRFGAYGLVTDPTGRVLLTLIAPGYPGSGRWHLPGGGTDFGEAPVDCVLRELAEEAGQRGRVTGLIGVSSGHFPAAVGPEGRPVDWHTVRVHYRVEVDEPRPIRVTEADGSTAEAAWFTPEGLRRVRLTDVAVSVIQDQLG